MARASSLVGCSVISYSAIFLRIRANRKAPRERGGHVELGLVGALDGTAPARGRGAAPAARRRPAAAAAAFGSPPTARRGRRRRRTPAPPARVRAASPRLARAARGLLAGPLGLRGGRLPALSASRRLRSFLASSFSARRGGLCAFASSSSARRSSVIGELLAQLGRARLGAARRASASRARPSRLRSSSGSALTREDLPRTRGPKSGGRAFVVAIEASAPSAASRPDHISRLTMSLSVIAAGV